MHRGRLGAYLLGAVVWLSTWGACGYADTPNPMRAPRQAQPTVPTRAHLSPPAKALDAAVQFFQQVISPVDGPRSTMYPTGSAYARQALAKHGAGLGLLLTIERLMHEGSEGQRAPRIRKYGIWRVYDPVEANDWWWQGSESWVYHSLPPANR